MTQQLDSWCRTDCVPDRDRHLWSARPLPLLPPSTPPPTRNTPSPFFGLHSRYCNWEECSVFWTKHSFPLSFFLLTFHYLVSLLKVFTIGFLNIPLLKQHIQIEKMTETLWKSSVTEGKSSKMTQGLNEYLGTVFTEYSQTLYTPFAFSHTISHLYFDKSSEQLYQWSHFPQQQ